MASVQQLTTKGKDTEEYQKMLQRSYILSNQLTAALCSRPLAVKLRSKQLIPETVYDGANNRGPGVTESARIQIILDCMIAKVEINSNNFHKFLDVLHDISGLDDLVADMKAPLPVSKNREDTDPDRDRAAPKNENTDPVTADRDRENENTDPVTARDRALIFCIIMATILLGIIAVMNGWIPTIPGSTLKVQIQINYSKPSDFLLEPPYYRIASSVKFTCHIREPILLVSYNWFSNCTGDCFLREREAQSIDTLILRPSDTGNYTCIAKTCVWEDCNRTASATVEIRVIGTGIFDKIANAALPNNGIIVARQHAYHMNLHFICWFSVVENDATFQVIDVNGSDIASSESPFNITTTAYGNSAVLEVVGTARLSSSHFQQGIYTCRLHQPNGKVNLNVGIYKRDFKTIPTVTSLRQNISAGAFTIECISTGSPPTNVIWMKDGVEMSTDGTVRKMIQTINNRTTSTYNNLLVINDSVNQLPGKYSCKVKNSFGTSNEESIMGTVINITGHEEVLIVGLTVNISCTTSLKHHAKIEWLRQGSQVLKTSHSQEVVLPLKPESTDLNGAKLICRITGPDDMEYYELNITLKVKAFENIVSIDVPKMTLIAGTPCSLSCVIRADVKGIAKWVESTGRPVVNTNAMSIDDPITEGNKTTLTLHFHPLHTSHGDQYTCVSLVDVLQSEQRNSTDVIVQIPLPVISVAQKPANVHTTSQLTLTCVVAVNEAVDTSVEIVSTWKGPNGVLNSSIHALLGQQETVAILESVTSSDAGSYICIANISPSSSNTSAAHIIASDESSGEPLNVVITLAVSIQVNYTPSVVKQQLYRAGSLISLQCSVVGASGPVTYRWTSTCNDCFVSGTSSTVTSKFLRSIDAGSHKCTVTDSIGTRGSTTISMNITGAGVYLRIGNQSGLITNNSLVVAKDSSPSLQLYCVSNSTKNNVGNLIGIDGHDITWDDYDPFNVTRYNPGGIQVTSPYSYQVQYSCNCHYNHCHMDRACFKTTTKRISASTQGMYTCKIPDSSGSFLYITFGVYPHGFNAPPRIKSVQRATSSDLFTVECISIDSPATHVTWFKDGTNLTIDESLYQKSQSITSRASSTYLNVLQINDIPTNIIGTYSCCVSNTLGTSSQEITISGLKLQGYERTFMVGETASVVCSSDLDVRYIKWHLDGDNATTSVVTSHNNLTFEFNPVSATLSDAQYTCQVFSPYGMQERTVSFHAQIPSVWATVEISRVIGATDGNEYNLTCIVMVIRGLTVDGVSVSWLGPAGNVNEESSLITRMVDNEATSNTTISSRLIFQPVRSTHHGNYTCQATIMIPGLNKPPPQTAQAHLVVTSVAAFQLMFGPVQHCIHWTDDKAIRVEQAIKAALTASIREHCNSNFSADAIEDGEFSCQTTDTKAVYRSKINGTSDTFTAPELLAFVEDWVKNEGTFRVGKFRFRTNSECPIHIQSFHQPECSVNTTLPSTPTCNNFS